MSTKALELQKRLSRLRGHVSEDSPLVQNLMALLRAELEKR